MLGEEGTCRPLKYHFCGCILAVLCLPVQTGNGRLGLGPNTGLGGCHISLKRWAQTTRCNSITEMREVLGWPIGLEMLENY